MTMDVNKLDIFMLYKGDYCLPATAPTHKHSFFLYLLSHRNSVPTTGQEYVLEGSLSCESIRINIQVSTAVHSIVLRTS